MRELILCSQCLQLIQLINKVLVSLLRKLCEEIISFFVFCELVRHFVFEVGDVVHVHLLVELLHEFGALAEALDNVLVEGA